MAQVIQHLREPLLQFPQSSASRRASGMLAEMVPLHRLLQPALDHYPDFLRVPPKDAIILRQQEAVYKKQCPHSQEMGWWFWSLDGYRCLSLFSGSGLQVVIGHDQKQTKGIRLKDLSEGKKWGIL